MAQTAPAQAWVFAILLAGCVVATGLAAAWHFTDELRLRAWESEAPIVEAPGQDTWGCGTLLLAGSLVACSLLVTLGAAVAGVELADWANATGAGGWLTLPVVAFVMAQVKAYLQRSY
jgi:hypothetical protein